MENLNLSKMTYKEFKDWCNHRAQDGNWSLLTAMACLSVIQEMESIKRSVRSKFSFNVPMFNSNNKM